MATVVLVGALDTKGVEYGWVRDRLRELGVDVLLVDAGVLGEPGVLPDISRDAVAAVAGVDLGGLIAANDRGQAITAMAAGAASVVQALQSAGRLDAIMGLGGGGGSALISEAMRALPVGVPKLLVSTVASGDTRPYVGMTDLTLMHSVVDIAGINRISEPILANACAAVAGMALDRVRQRPVLAERPLVAATMFGVTTPGVTAVRGRLETLGYEVVVFHATGIGGAAMEHLVRDGFFAGVLDMTTTELADELAGGVMSAGSDRLTGAGAVGIPQVVSLGALDMVNFGPIESVPERYRDRRLYQHNAAVTLMRTTPEECAELGRRLASRLNGASGPVTLFIPRGGISSVAVVGGVFHDPDADRALFEAVREHASGNVRVVDADTDINDPSLAVAMADELNRLIVGGPGSGEGNEA